MTKTPSPLFSICTSDDDLRKKIPQPEEYRFSVIVIVLKKDDDSSKIDFSSSIEQKFEKGIIVYQRPVNINLAMEIRDKLAKGGITEIKDFFYDNSIDDTITGVNTLIKEWNDCPENEETKLKIKTCIDLSNTSSTSRDAPINLYASAMIGKMGELLLKLNQLANNFADFILNYFSSGNQKENPATDLAQVYRQGNSTKKRETPSLKNESQLPIPAWKAEIQNTIKNNNAETKPPSGNVPRLPKILLIGDSGVGKTLVANYIHTIVGNRLKEKLGSDVNKRPARIGIPEFEKKEDELEYALFGYTPNAFTGAAESGSLGLLLENICQVVFLDEIGTATPSIQNKLLTYLDDYNVRPRGMNNGTIFCPTLVVAATNERNKLKDPKQFRSDLLARFTDRLVIPNIQERIDDKEENLLYLLDCILQEEDINPQPHVDEIGKQAFQRLFDHCKEGKCIGNFRELENIMREACEQARKDKRNYMVEQDVENAMKNLNLTPQEAEPSQNKQNEISEGRSISNDEIQVFLGNSKCMKKNDEVRKRVCELINGYRTLGQSKIKRQLLKENSSWKNLDLSAIQRLSKAFRRYFNLPSCREAIRLARTSSEQSKKKE